MIRAVDDVLEQTLKLWGEDSRMILLFTKLMCSLEAPVDHRHHGLHQVEEHHVR